MCHDLSTHICTCLKLQSSSYHIYKFLELYINKYKFEFHIQVSVKESRFEILGISHRGIYIVAIYPHQWILSKCLRGRICFLYILIKNREYLAPSSLHSWTMNTWTFIICYKLKIYSHFIMFQQHCICQSFSFTIRYWKCLWFGRTVVNDDIWTRFLKITV